MDKTSQTFKYLGVTLTDYANSKNELAIRIATSKSIMVRLKNIKRS